MEAETLKKNISRILHERGWKLQDLERKAGTNRNIHNIFRNKSNNPSIDLLQKISKTLNVDYKELLEDQSNTNYINNYFMSF
jgi:transcriptional regulator with XRE-family HTH domain